MKSKLAVLLAAVAGVVVPHALHAQGTYPDRTVRIVVPYPPGGSADLLGRLTAQYLGDTWGKAVVVENRGGAGGNIGTDAVARAEGDGYTMLICNAPVMAINPTLYGKVPFDPIRDFTPAAMIAEVPLYLVVNAAFQAKNLAEFVDAAKKAAGNLNYASGSTGSTTHLAMELFKSMSGLSLQHVPYKGSGPAIAAVLAGEVPVMFELMPTAMPHVKSGRMRALAVTSSARSPISPELPTVAELGFAGFDVSSWFGLCMPSATPKVIVDKVSADLNAQLVKSDVQKRILDMGAQPKQMKPDEFSRFLRAEIAKWSKVVKDSGASAQ